jgi:hypothetical protein
MAARQLRRIRTQSSSDQRVGDTAIGTDPKDPEGCQGAQHAQQREGQHVAQRGQLLYVKATVLRQLVSNREVGHQPDHP